MIHEGSVPSHSSDLALAGNSMYRSHDFLGKGIQIPASLKKKNKIVMLYNSRKAFTNQGENVKVLFAVCEIHLFIVANETTQNSSAVYLSACPGLCNAQ